MVEEREDPQKIKRIAASTYDYDNDPRWADYWSNILIPPNMAARSDVVDHYKRKFYQRYIDPDLVVESVFTSSSSQPTQASASSTSSTTTNRNSGSTTRASRTSASAGSNATSVRWDRQTIQFSVNAWVFVVAMLAIFPLGPKNLSNRAYRLSFMGTACSSLYSLYSLYGRPGAWNLQALQVYFHSVEYVAKFLRRNFGRSTLYRKYLENACVWVESNSTTLSLLSSHAEVVLGFLLIFSLLSWQRNIIQTFMYWQLLKLMYHAPVTASYHQSVWAKIGRTVNPLIHRYAPFLNTPISAIQRWWFR